MGEACVGLKTQPHLTCIDIGPTGDWGYPANASASDRWGNYHSEIWKIPQSADADLFFVDGRFRVACFAQVVLHCKNDAIIGIHDFASRPQYHSVREISREIASAGDMSFFLPLENRNLASALLEKFYNDPA